MATGCRKLTAFYSVLMKNGRMAYKEEPGERMAEKKAREALDIALEAYAKGGIYPFHMPGHKRNPLPMPNPYTIDITEIDGFDNLHQPEGILKEAQDRAAQLYGAKHSFYLVNGSTCGILTAVFAAVPFGGTLLMARNSHKAVYHAAYLRNLSTVYLYPHITRLGVSGAIAPEEVERQLSQNPSVDAVILTSPTYEGVVSDIAAIARIVHRYGIPLIVDEAHGAHFGFHPAFPQTAVRFGADLVIQSMHKTLPSLTQTALLHLNGTRILPKSIEKYRGMFETSSPSYVLMAGMEKCMRLLFKESDRLFTEYAGRLAWFYEKTRSLQRLHIMSQDDFAKHESFCLDPSKILIFTKGASVTGRELYEKLLGRYRLQMEMVSGFSVLAMTSIMDREEGYLRLIQALFEMDAGFLGCKDKDKQEEDSFFLGMYAPKQKEIELCQAMDLLSKEVSFDDAPGQCSGSMVSLYPPGVPVLLPGEKIDADFIKNVRKCKEFQLNLQGIADIRNERISVVKR